MKTIIILSSIVLVLVLAGFFAQKKGLIGQENYTKVAIAIAEPKEVTGIVSATGKIYPAMEVSISPDVPGEIIELYIEEGDSVSQGQVLLKIQPDDLKAMLNRTVSGLEGSKAQKQNAQARLTQAEAQLTNAQAEYNRSKQLYQEELISQQQLLQAELTFNTARAEKQAAIQNVKAAEHTINMSANDVQQASINYKRTIVRAPQAGIISKLNVEKGERVVGTSQMAGTEMLTIADFKNMECRVEVSEIDIAKVEVGDSCKVEVDSYRGKQFTGIVTKISNSLGGNANLPTSNDQVTNFMVYIKMLPESYAELSHKKFPFRPGMSASVDVITSVEKDKLAIPLNAVTAKTQKQYKQFINDSTSNTANDKDLLEYVFIIKEGKTQLVPVTTSTQDGYQDLIVVDEGLQNGDSVVIAPFSAISKSLKNDEQVEIVDKQNLYN